jgi:hypothetical protein
VSEAVEVGFGSEDIIPEFPINSPDLQQKRVKVMLEKGARARRKSRGSEGMVRVHFLHAQRAGQDKAGQDKDKARQGRTSSVKVTLE